MSIFSKSKLNFCITLSCSLFVICYTMLNSANAAARELADLEREQQEIQKSISANIALKAEHERQGNLLLKQAESLHQERENLTKWQEDLTKSCPDLFFSGEIKRDPPDPSPECTLQVKQLDTQMQAHNAASKRYQSEVLTFKEKEDVRIAEGEKLRTRLNAINAELAKTAPFKKIDAFTNCDATCENICSMIATKDCVLIKEKCRSQCVATRQQAAEKLDSGLQDYWQKKDLDSIKPLPPKK